MIIIAKEHFCMSMFLRCHLGPTWSQFGANRARSQVGMTLYLRAAWLTTIAQSHNSKLEKISLDHTSHLRPTWSQLGANKK